MSISSESAEIRELSVTLVFSRVKQTDMFCCGVQASALIGFDSFTSLLATHQFINSLNEALLSSQNRKFKMTNLTQSNIQCSQHSLCHDEDVSP